MNQGGSLKYSQSGNSLIFLTNALKQVSNDTHIYKHPNYALNVMQIIEKESIVTEVK